MDIGIIANKFKVYLLRKGLSKAYTQWLVADYLYIARKSGKSFPSAEDIENIYDGMIELGLSPSRLSNYLKTVRHYCSFAEMEPPKLTAPRETRQRVTYLTEIEAARLLDACDKIRDYAILCVMLYAGLRRSEVANMRLGDLNLPERILTVRGTKTHTEAECILHKVAAEALAMWIKRRPRTSHDVLFTSQSNKPIRAERVGQLVKLYARKAHLKKNVTAHVLRHTLATNLLINGADITLVQKQLRHRSIQSTLIYTHITTAKQKELYDRFSPEY